MIRNSFIHDRHSACGDFSSAPDKLLSFVNKLQGRIVHRTRHKELCLISGEKLGSSFDIIIKCYRKNRFFHYLLDLLQACREFYGLISQHFPKMVNAGVSQKKKLLSVSIVVVNFQRDDTLKGGHFMHQS